MATAPPALAGKDTSPERVSLLGRFRGERPPAARWFQDAIAVAPERSVFAVDGTPIELLTWGKIGAPGLLFLHGNGAHADWWSFIAPLFADSWRCAAISWSGMGGSGWRSAYDIETFGREALGAIEASGLDQGSQKPILVGHSFGGVPLLHLAANYPERLAAGILIDSLIPKPNRRPAWITSGKPPTRYPTLAAALARFRFAPEQTSEWPEITDHLARGSLRYAEREGDQPAGWTWRFDPKLWTTMDRTGADALVDRVPVPIGLIYGSESTLVTAQSVRQMQTRLPCCPLAVAIPEARHHIMVDQPIALIATLRVATQALPSLGRSG